LFAVNSIGNRVFNNNNFNVSGNKAFKTTSIGNRAFK
jgi:hypothetical protein